MNIKFNKLLLNNFLSFENAELNFLDRGYTFVKGSNYCKSDNSLSNGSGKSSLWEAVIWCLTGETIRGAKEVKRIGSSENCFVRLEFSVDSDTYVIERYSKPSKLFFYKNGEDISGKGIQDTKKIIAQHLPDLTADLLGSVIILGQGLPQKFSNNTPSGRKEVLETLSRSGFMIDDLKSRTANRKSYLSAQLRQNEDKLLQDTTLKNNCEVEIHKLTDELEQVKDVSYLEEKITQLTNALSKYESEKESAVDKVVTKDIELENERMKLGELNATYNERMSAISEKFQPTLNTLQNEISSAEFRLKFLNSEIAKIKNIKDVCPTCGQKLPNVVKPDTSSYEDEINNIQNSLVAKKQEYDNLTLEFNNEKQIFSSTELQSIKELKDLIEKLSSDKCILLQSVDSFSDKIALTKEELNKLNIEKSEHDVKIESYKKIIESNEKQLSDLEKEILYINNVIDNLNLHIQIVNKIETSLKRDFRGYLLNNIIKYIDAQSKLYCKDVFNTDKINFSLEGNNISISYDGKEYECLSGGEKQKVDLIVQFSIRDMLCKYLNFSSNILILDEITDNLDIVGCQNVFNLISSRLKDIENVYIISHHSDLQFPIDYQLTVVKGEDGISRLQ